MLEKLVFWKNKDIETERRIPFFRKLYALRRNFWGNGTVNQKSADAREIPSISGRRNSEPISYEKEGRYSVIKSCRYAFGVQALRDAYARGEYPDHPIHIQSNDECVVRPLTAKENLEVRMNNYETIYDSNGKKRTREERLKLFNTCLSSCTGIAYKAGSTKFKILPLCKELININEEFCRHYLPVDYDALRGIELDGAKGNYCRYLKKSEVLMNPVWNILSGDNSSLLRDYCNIIFAEISSEIAMGFSLASNVAVDQLRPLFVDGFDGSSFSSACSMRSSAEFVGVFQKKALKRRIKFEL